MSATSDPFSAGPGALPGNAIELDRFFAMSLDLLCIAGLDGRWKRVNPSWTRVLGWSEEELLARPIVDFMHPEDRARTLQARSRLAQGIPVSGLENRYLCKDGSHRWLSWQSSLYREAGLVFAVARDITERRRSEQEHLVLSKLESTGLLAAGIAHDFNNLLAGLLLNLEMIRLVGVVSPAQLPHLRQAQETVHLAEALTRQLVTFAEGARVPRRVIDLKPLLRRSLELAVTDPSILAESDMEPDLWPVEIEEPQIRQVVKNLVRNACEAMPGGGVVKLAARNVTLDAEHAGDTAPGDYVCFTVTDRGAGIPAEVQDKVFDPYFSTKRRGPQKGMGLGLTICHAILRQHDGQIVVDSRPGVGTAVRCYLPALRDAAPAIFAEAAEVPAPAGDAHRVLVMDDEPWLRDLLGKALEQFGYKAELAKDGDEAIAFFRAAQESGRPFAGVILDLTVRGGMGGCEVLQVLREMDPKLRAVLMTGYDNGTGFLDHARLGFQAALPKPFTIHALRAALAGLVGG